MSEVLVQSIAVDSRGRLRVQLANSSYGYIWRDASSVRWDDSTSELYVLHVPGFDALAQFKQISSAVKREYGDHLVLSSSTKYIGMSDELIASLREPIG
jgi:hypothetical protein